MSVFAAAAMQVYHSHRPIYLADSFRGLPKPRVESSRPDEAWYTDTKINQTLAVGEQHVLGNFDTYGVPRDNVQTVPGYFVHGLPPVREKMLARGEKIAILRLDGDMYDSTIDILYNMYDLVAVGGYIIIDDFGWDHATKPAGGEDEAVPLFGAKKAVLDFRALHGIEDKDHAFHDVDGLCAWFRKTREVNLQRDRYLASLKSHGQKPLMPSPRLTNADYHALMLSYNAAVGVAETSYGNTRLIEKAQENYVMHAR